MNPFKQMEELLERLQAAGGDNLQSVILYGSAAGDQFHPKYSDINLLCLVRDTSLAKLEKLAPVVAWWVKQKYPPPQVMTASELERSADVFAIEMLDLKQRHKLVYGEDVLSKVEVPMGLHRVELEHDLRSKLLLLRQHALLAQNREQKLDLMLRSLSSFKTLVRHALIALGETPAAHGREAVERLAKMTGLDVRPLHLLMELREGKRAENTVDVEELLGRYLAAIEQVTDKIDRLLEKQTATG